MTQLIPEDGFWERTEGESQLRLVTLVRLRWLAIFGQLLAVIVVGAGFGFDMPVGWCLFFVACSAWLNVYLSVKYPARHRLTIRFATGLLAYDILQLAALLYLTGGIENPFTMLIVAPVTVSAATLPLANTIVLGALAAVSTILLAVTAYRLPWHAGIVLDHPALYDFGMVSAVIATMTFIALYARRLTREGRQMSAALAATELVLAREQKLHALDGLAAAAAHELGTPLSTIVLVTKELAQSLPKGSTMIEDVELLRQQALRCREILQKLTKSPAEQDPMHANLTLREMLNEAAAPYGNARAPIFIFAHPESGTDPGAAREPVAARRPGVLYGLGNILENAVDFAESRVDLVAEWSGANVVITVADDGPGFSPDIIDTLGEPYVTTRPAGARRPAGVKAGGLGLGFFIAKTLLERSGARLTLENRAAPQTGAVVRIVWPRAQFEAGSQAGREPALPKDNPAVPGVEVFDR
ncbi:MAG: ActS/PrrB/RegB family redox-sensitive histidine kinase [Hyphomicrobium sp.]|nr:ActS/PrrB/RegB family redox-sensitive histidine kinase [Hyphomicrobium sp.]